MTEPKRTSQLAASIDEPSEVALRSQGAIPILVAVSNSIDGHAVGRVVNDWNTGYPATPLRIDALTRDAETIYSAQLRFPDGTTAEFDVTETALRAPTNFTKLLTRYGPGRYSQGQWMLFDELFDGAFRLVTERMGGVWDVDSLPRQEIAARGGYPKPKIGKSRALPR